MKTDLDLIPHYINHPQMKPFIGTNWGKINKILLIGESHSLVGLADEQTIKNWYITTNEKFKENLIYNTSTQKLINNGLKENFGKNRIYSEINNRIKDVDNKLDITFFSFMNFYQRPAIKKNEVFDKKDDSVANKTVNEVIKVIEPDYIFFLSSTAWMRFNIEYENKILMTIFDSGKIGYSCHPTNSWWNRKSNENLVLIGRNDQEKNTGKEAFRKFIEIAIQ